jgi:hypothetical protein
MTNGAKKGTHGAESTITPIVMRYASSKSSTISPIVMRRGNDIGIGTKKTEIALTQLIKPTVEPIKSNAPNSYVNTI